MGESRICRMTRGVGSVKSLMSGAVRHCPGSFAGHRPLARLRAVAMALIFLAGLFVVAAGPLARPVAATDTACHTVSTWYQPPSIMQSRQVWYQPPSIMQSRQVWVNYPPPGHLETQWYWYTPIGYFKTEWYWYQPPGYYTNVTTCAPTFVVLTANPYGAGVAHNVTVTAGDAYSNVATW